MAGRILSDEDQSAAAGPPGRIDAGEVIFRGGALKAAEVEIGQVRQRRICKAGPTPTAKLIPATPDNSALLMTFPLIFRNRNSFEPRQPVAAMTLR
jgi:hypothetical protein